MSAVLTALRDGAFGRRILNFAISAYALITIYATLFTRGHIEAGAVMPAIDAHQHITSFVRWIGLPGPADWIQAHIVDPALHAPNWTSFIGWSVLVASVIFHALRGPSVTEFPAQPSFGVVLGATVLVDLHGNSLGATALAAAAAIYAALVIGQDGPWDKSRLQIPLVHALIAPLAVILSAPVRICAFIAVAPTDMPLRVRVVNSNLDPVQTRTANRSPNTAHDHSTN